MSDATTSGPGPRDADLMSRVARGEEQALGVLYDRFGQVLYAVAYRIVGQKADAEEVVMEAFAQAWREAGTVRCGTRLGRRLAHDDGTEPGLGSDALADTSRPGHG